MDSTRGNHHVQQYKHADANEQIEGHLIVCADDYVMLNGIYLLDNWSLIRNITKLCLSFCLFACLFSVYTILPEKGKRIF